MPNNTMSFDRQEALFNPAKHQELVEIIGAGAVGSFTALALAKMGINRMKVWDMDTIESHNLPNQFYPLKCVGKLKVGELRQMVQDFTGVSLDIINNRFTKKNLLAGDVIIAAVDSMDTRKIIFAIARFQTNPKIKWFIDPRMGGEVMRIYTVNLNNNDEIKAYESTLYTHAEAAKIPCSARSVIYNVLVMSGLIANQVKKVLNKEDYKREIIFDLKTMTFVTDVTRGEI